MAKGKKKEKEFISFDKRDDKSSDDDTLDKDLLNFDISDEDDYYDAQLIDNSDILPEVKEIRKPERDWGNKKSIFHGSDQKLHKQIEDYDEQEEKEAVRLQQMELEELNIDDYEDMLIPIPSKSSSIDENKSLILSNIEYIQKDMSNITVKDKKKLIKRQNPEILTLIEELKSSLSQIKLYDKFLKMKLPNIQTNGKNYIEYKYSLLWNYIHNIIFLFTLKANGNNIKSHPIINHILKIKTFLDNIKPNELYIMDQLNRLDDIVNLKGNRTIGSTDINNIHENNKQKSNKKRRVNNNTNSNMSVDDKDNMIELLQYDDHEFTKMPNIPKKNRLVVENHEEIIDKFNEVIHDVDETTKIRESLNLRKGDNLETTFKKKIAIKVADDNEINDDNTNQQSSGKKYDNIYKRIYNDKMKKRKRDNSVEDDEYHHRKITRTIMKNRGLVPSRNAKNRNPRVHKKRQYEKAVKRRIGQVAPTREYENYNYTGESTGIKADVVHSRQIRN